MALMMSETVNFRQGLIYKALHDRLNSKTLLLLSGDGNGRITFKQFSTRIDATNPMPFLFLTECFQLFFRPNKRMKAFRVALNCFHPGVFIELQFLQDTGSTGINKTTLIVSDYTSCPVSQFQIIVQRKGNTVCFE